METSTTTSTTAFARRTQPRPRHISRRTARRLASFAPLFTVALAVATLATWIAAIPWLGCLDGEACLAAHQRKLVVGAVIVGASLLARLAAAYFDELADAPDVDR